MELVIMEWLIVKMPVIEYEEHSAEVVKNWVIEERYEDSEEITRTEVATKIIQQGLTDLRKALFDLKHPKE